MKHHAVARSHGQFAAALHFELKAGAAFADGLGDNITAAAGAAAELPMVAVVRDDHRVIARTSTTFEVRALRGIHGSKSTPAGA